MRVIGYADRLVAAPADRIRFMVSCETGAYRADLVRLTGDSAAGGFCEEPVPSTVEGTYEGRLQPLPLGSFLRVSAPERFAVSSGWTLQAWVLPTLPGSRQAIVSQRCAATGRGWALCIDPDGGVGLDVGDGDGVAVHLGTGTPLEPRTWHLVGASFDAASREACVWQRPLSAWPGIEPVVRRERIAGLPAAVTDGLPVLIAAEADERSPSGTAAHFNGRIESPRAYRRALDERELASLWEGADPAPSDLEAAWDLGAEPSSARVVDRSPRAHHAEAVNTPTRAVTGHAWDGSVQDFAKAPEQYAAIHFHDDDLTDAQWESDFSLVVPEDLPSGAYAVRLTAGDERDRVPFWVRPMRDAQRAPVAFLASTFTDLVYANYAIFVRDAEKAAFLLRDDALKRGPTPEEEATVALGLRCGYDVHPDGSGVMYVSKLRPLLTFRPDFTFNANGAPASFSADLRALEWLEHEGVAWDVVTDEDLHAEGEAALAPYAVVVTGSHPEYWSAAMLDGLRTYLDAGGRLMYLGGNGFWGVVSPLPEEPHVIEVRRGLTSTRSYTPSPGEEHHSSTGELGGTWHTRGRRAYPLVGVGFTAMGAGSARPYRRLPDSFDPRARYVFDGVGADEPIGAEGDFLGAAGGWEVDRFDVDAGTPPHALRLATADGFSDHYQLVLEDVEMADSLQGGTVCDRVRADMTLLEYPNGGGVFSVGSISWIGALAPHGFDNAAARVTANVLHRFRDRSRPIVDR